MKRTVITTSDGSTTFKVDKWNETFHSIHGAVQEAKHVYIKEGFDKMIQSAFSILEMGFGTGLNALLSLQRAQELNKRIQYTAVEGFPLNNTELNQVNYTDFATLDNFKKEFEQLHAIPWERYSEINKYFTLCKVNATFENFTTIQKFDLIYYDVFGYPCQPELWTIDLFNKMYKTLHPQGVLVTYACRKVIKDTMKEAGFDIEVLKGPPGKREMLRAVKRQ